MVNSPNSSETVFRLLSTVLSISEVDVCKQAQHRTCSQAGLADSLESSVFMLGLGLCQYGGTAIILGSMLQYLVA